MTSRQPQCAEFRLLSALVLACGLLTNPATAAGTAEIQLPSGLDIERLKLADKGQQMRVYVSLLGYDDTRGGAAVYPGEPGAILGTVTQMNRRFMDMVSGTRRFQVFDDTDTGIREESDIVINGQITRANQVLERFLRGRKAITSVGLSIQIKNSQNGSLLDQHQAIETYGQRPGEGALALTVAEQNSPDFKKRASEDYEEAFARVLEHAAAYFESSMRPLAKVSATQCDKVQLLGGNKQGLQAGDELVLFSLDVKVSKVPQPLAEVRCDAVGRDTSTCRITRRAPDADAPKKGHYAILSDNSLKLRFE